MSRFGMTPIWRANILSILIEIRLYFVYGLLIATAFLTACANVTKSDMSLADVSDRQNLAVPAVAKSSPEPSTSVHSADHRSFDHNDTSVLASSAETATENYCRARFAESQADARILLYPTLQGGYSRPDAADRRNLEPDSTSAYVGLEITPSNVFVVKALKDRAKADCRLETAQQGLLQIMDQLTAFSRATAYAAKADTLALRMEASRKIQREITFAVGAGTATIDEKLNVDKTVAEIVAASTEATRLAAIEKTKFTLRSDLSVDSLLRDFIDAQKAAARANNDLRRSRALTTSVFASGTQEDETGDSGVQFGVKSSFALGSLFNKQDEKTIEEASAAHAMGRLRGTPQSLLLLSRVVDAERRQGREALKLLEVEYRKSASKAAELASIKTERAKRLVQLIQLRSYLTEGDTAYHSIFAKELDRLSLIIERAQT